MNSLKEEPVRSLLERLHQQAKGDRIKFLGMLPRFISGKLRGKAFGEILTPTIMKDVFIPVSPEQGRLLYLTARAIGASSVVEFGTSFGISTIYLGAAVKDNGGGRVIGTEIEASKRERAMQHLQQAELSDVVEVRLGDALETLVEVEAPIDMVLLDGWKDGYLPVLKLLVPKLRRGSVVMADNIFTFPTELGPYVDFVQSGDSGFASTTLHIADGMEYSVYLKG